MGSIRKIGILVAIMAVALPAMATDLAILHNGFSIPHERRETVGAVTRLYLGSDKGFVDIATSQIERFEKDLSPAVVPSVAGTIAPALVAKPQDHKTVETKPQNINEVINAISDRHHLDPDFVSSVIHAESGFNPRAVSPKGARGLMQLMPGTASKLGVSNSFDPQSNVEGGTRYLSELLQRYNYDVAKALAAYNAGPQRVQQYGGVPPYYETRTYVARIVRDYNRKKLAQRKAAAVAAKATGTSASKTAAPAAVAKQAAALPASPSQVSR